MRLWISIADWVYAPHCGRQLRLKEMEARGEIGQLSDHIWSGFMGRIYNRSKVLQESGPNFVNGLKAEGVDVLLAVPT